MKNQDENGEDIIFTGNDGEVANSVKKNFTLLAVVVVLMFGTLFASVYLEPKKNQSKAPKPAQVKQEHNQKH